jgi:hypothetical protein
MFLTGGTMFVLGVILGFTTALYRHTTSDLVFAITTCLLSICLSSLRLPIIYHMLIPEDPTAWRNDTSWSLLLAVSVIGLAAGLSLPAEIMLVEIVLNDPTQLHFENGGWVCAVYALLPLGIGIVATIGDLREESIKRGRYAAIRRHARNMEGRKGDDSVVLMVEDDER